MFLLLVVLLIGGHEEAFTILVDGDDQACIQEGKAMKNVIRFQCSPVKTDKIWREI